MTMNMENIFIVHSCNLNKYMNQMCQLVYIYIFSNGSRIKYVSFKFRKIYFVLYVSYNTNINVYYVYRLTKSI